MSTFFQGSNRSYTDGGSCRNAQSTTQFTTGLQSAAAGTSSSRSLHTSAVARLSAGNWRLKNGVADHDVAETVTMPLKEMKSVRNQSSDSDSIKSKSDNIDSSRQLKKTHKAEVNVILMD